MQGDIVGILDSTGALVIEYKYDAWGKPIATAGNLADTLGKRNPFRYRGYVYEEETGLYYLESRYYNPECVRFINSDKFDVLEDNNALVNKNWTHGHEKMDTKVEYPKPPSMTEP